MKGHLIAEVDDRKIFSEPEEEFGNWSEEERAHRLAERKRPSLALHDGVGGDEDVDEIAIMDAEFEAAKGLPASPVSNEIKISAAIERFGVDVMWIFFNISNPHDRDFAMDREIKNCTARIVKDLAAASTPIADRNAQETTTTPEGP